MRAIGPASTEPKASAAYDSVKHDGDGVIKERFALDDGRERLGHANPTEDGDDCNRVRSGKDCASRVR